MTPRPRRRPRTPPNPRAQAEAQGYDMGSPGIAVVVEHVAVGTRATHPRARRRSNVEGIQDVTTSMIKAADRLCRAWEHMQAGIGMGPRNAEVEQTRVIRRDGLGVQLLCQERAISSAAAFRAGMQAAGIEAGDLVVWVAIDGKGLRAWEMQQGWRNGSARPALLAALDRMAVAYDLA